MIWSNHLIKWHVVKVIKRIGRTAKLLESKCVGQPSNGRYGGARNYVYKVSGHEVSDKNGRNPDGACAVGSNCLQTGANSNESAQSGSTKACNVDDSLDLYTMSIKLQYRSFIR